MKTADEIQRAHDLFRMIVLDDELFDQMVNASHHERMVAALDVFCWILGHEHNLTFAENLSSIEARLKALGIVLLRMPEMVYPEGNG